MVPIHFGHGDAQASISIFFLTNWFVCLYVCMYFLTNCMYVCGLYVCIVLYVCEVLMGICWAPFDQDSSWGYSLLPGLWLDPLPMCKFALTAVSVSIVLNTFFLSAFGAFLLDCFRGMHSTDQNLFVVVHSSQNALQRHVHLLVRKCTSCLSVHRYQCNFLVSSQLWKHWSKDIYLQLSYFLPYKW